MSKIIPPLISDSPPPPPEEEDEDEEFDEFRGSNDISYGCDSFSLTPSPEHTPKKLPKEGLTINEHDCEFQFETVSPEISKKDKENLEVDNVKSLKDSVEIHSENLNHVNEYAFHNSFHKDNIPSQFIIQSSEKEIGECDNDRTINRVQVSNEAVVDEQVTNGTDQSHDENNSDEITNEETNSISNEIQGQMDAEQEQSVPVDSKDDLYSVHSTQDNDLVSSKFEELSDSLKENSYSNNKDFIFKEDSQNLEQKESKDFDDVLEETGGDSKDDFSSFCDGGDSKNEDFSSFCGQLENFNPFPTLPDECQNNNDDFANFASFPPMPENDSKKCDDEFDDFTSFPGEVTAESTPTSTNLADSKVSDDEFDDFGEFTTSTTILQSEPPKAFLLINEKEAFKKTEEIVKDIFVQQDEAANEFQYFELGKNDAIFTQLQDITDTPALSYNWSKSSSQKLLLKALNIDSRNLLYGPSWNSSIPRFAANLGNQPLEPVKMEPLTPTPIEPSPTVSQCSQPQQEVAEIPSAEFDWTGSGLVNPLDYSQTTLLDIEQLVASLDIPNTNPAQRTSIFDEDWDVWLKHAPVEPAKSPEDDYEEFAEFQHSKPPSDWPNVPLRETHISDVPRGDIDIDVVLQPTIVTPEMPRKTTNTEDYPEGKDSQAIDDTAVQAKGESDDDDFTEFHCSAPAPVVAAAPILQPTPVYAASASTEINWPDPGVTEDELKRFEEAFSTTMPKKESSPVDRGKDDARENVLSIEKVENATVVGVQQADIDKKRRSISIWDSPPSVDPAKRNESKKLETKQNSFEDEEWSDFVSVQKLSPVHKTKNSDRNQTASPDLPLSVLNLGNIQPAKQPIPVITPQGLVQTKLSSNMNPPVQPKAAYQRSVNSYDMPSLISNQYASQAYGLSTASKPGQSAQNGQDDDEWGEFVSNTLPQQYQNSSIASGHHSWNNFVPNANHGGQAGVNLQKKSSNLSSLVLPELDFLALRERNGVPKKK